MGQEPEGSSSVTNDFRHRTRGEIPQSADHTSARESCEHQSGLSREAVSKGSECRSPRQRVSDEVASRRRTRVATHAAWWPHMRHGGVHDHAEKCNDDPEKSCSRSNNFVTRRSRMGETVGLGSPRPREAEGTIETGNTVRRRSETDALQKQRRCERTQFKVKLVNTARLDDLSDRESDIQLRRTRTRTRDLQQTVSLSSEVDTPKRRSTQYEESQ